MWVSLIVENITNIALIGIVVLIVMFRNIDINLIWVAFVSLEGMQLRVGPQTVGVWGVLQPLADAVKLLAKKSILPNHTNTIIFLLALAEWAGILFGTESQFVINQWISISIIGVDLWITNSSLTMIIAIVLIRIAYKLSIERGYIVPTRIQSIVDILYETVYRFIKDNIGDKGMSRIKYYVEKECFGILRKGNYENDKYK